MGGADVTRVERGNGWEMHLGKCEEIMPSLAFADHVITDPPYEDEAHTKQRRTLKDATQRRGATNRGEVRHLSPTLSFDAMTEELRALVCAQFARIAKRWVVAFCQIEGVAPWRLAMQGSGLDWVRGGVWVKPNGMPQFTGDRPGQGFESLAISHTKGRKRWNSGGKHAVWVCPLDHRAGAGGASEHPTTKPTDLMVEIVRDFTDEGETVLDAFAGSGTTGVACIRTGRRFVGIERDEVFFSLCCERLHAESKGSTLAAQRAGQVALFGGAR